MGSDTYTDTKYVMYNTLRKYPCQAALRVYVEDSVSPSLAANEQTSMQ